MLLLCFAFINILSTVCVRLACMSVCVFVHICVSRIMWCTSDISILCFLAWTAWSRQWEDVCLIMSMIKAIDLGSWASTPQPLSQSYDSHCGQQAIAKSAAIRCTSVASYICLFLDMCVRVKWTCLSCSHQISCSYYAVRVLCALQAWDVVANISRYNTRKYIKNIYIFICP